MSDLIDRRAAIDEIARWIGYIDEDMILRIQTGLKKVPSAQPEIIRCKDCKHRDAEDGFCKGRGWPMQLVPEDGFCDKGERRSENG